MGRILCPDTAHPRRSPDAKNPSFPFTPFKMPWMVVHVSQTPPEDQPWLISTRGDLARDETEMESIKAAYAAACPMPSAESDKLAWLKAAAAFSERKHMEEFDWSFPDPPDVLPSMLRASCPDEVFLEVRMERRAVEELSLDAEHAQIFSDHMHSTWTERERVVRRGYSCLPPEMEEGCPWKTYKQWLLNVDQPPPSAAQVAAWTGEFEDWWSSEIGSRRWVAN